jgi:hypothetical protein
MPWEEEGQQGQGPAAGDQGNGQGTGAQGQQGQQQSQQGQQQQGQGGQQGQQQNDAARVAQAMREELNQLKTQNQLLQQQVQLYQANMGQGMAQGQQGQHGQAQQAHDPFADLDEDDVVDVPTMKRIFSQFQQATSRQLREIQLRAQFPDIEETIRDHLPNALNKNPGLQQALRQSGDPLLAYQIAKYEKQLREGANGQGQGNGSAQDQGQDVTQRILNNLGKPQNPGTTGGGGSGVDAAHAYLNMSDDDLEKRIAEVKSRG